ncbi:thiol-disulfide oxidoreductase DCC family protein [Paenarthrobacter sp. YIM B13468]|uniref:thiol-disulfide oxidoreductase DCC family protein n=1 Tax=Paenarthrobacter sp. YIM B13468 TaxID=3366295 RepID=UPI00366ABA36
MTMGDVALERTLIYDADCGFCTRSAKWLAGEGKVSIKSWQSIRDLEALGLTEEMVEAAAYWADDGVVTAGAESAIAQALITKGSGWQLAGRFILLPGVHFVAARVYKVIAKNRHAMPGGTDACRLPN